MENKKIKNAKKCSIDGIDFKSRLELYTYKRLKEEGLNFSYEAKTWTIIEKFEYLGEKIRAVTITPDFVNLDKKIIIEVKGYATDIYKLRLKVFKKHLGMNRDEYTIYHVKNQKQVEDVILDIKRKDVQSSN